MSRFAVKLWLLITVQVRRPLVHRSREWLSEMVRRAHREQGLLGREPASRSTVSRRTVPQAIQSPLPPKRKSPPPRPNVLEPVKVFIDQILREDLDALLKHRRTIVRITARMAAYQDFEPARQTTVGEYVHERRPEIKAQAPDEASASRGCGPQARKLDGVPSAHIRYDNLKPRSSRCCSAGRGRSRAGRRSFKSSYQLPVESLAELNERLAAIDVTEGA